MTDMEAFIREQQNAYAQSQGQLAELAKAQGVSLDGVKALDINYDTVQLDDDSTLQGLQRCHQRYKAQLADVYEVQNTQADKPVARRTPLRAI